MIDADRLSGWVVGAPSGASLELGRGAALPPGLRQQVTLLSDRGLIHPVRARSQSGEFLFQVQRSSVGFGCLSGPSAAKNHSARRVASAGASESRALLAAQTKAAVLRALRSAIRRGRPCPTNVELLDHCLTAGLAVSGLPAIKLAVRRIALAGLVRFEQRCPTERRIATDPLTGAATPPGALPVTGAARARMTARRAAKGWGARR